MKRFLYNIWVLSIVGLLVSCTDDDTVWKDAGGGSIKLQFSDGLLLSRAADDTENERAIKHLDVFIFNENHQDLIYERINNPTTSGEDNEGTVTLKASLSDFTSRARNYVYVIANATTTFTGTESWDDLKGKIQEDLNIHMTGTGLSGMPTHFLMDGIATDGNNATDGSVTINANTNDDVTLEVVLKRAAAKVVVTLKQGGDYKLLQDASNTNRGYYFRNMPYKTTLLDVKDNNGNQVYPIDDYLRTPDKANDQVSFAWGTDRVVITGYLYSHKWYNSSLESGTGHYYETGTSLIVNIPLWNDANKDNVLDTDEDVFINSYYQIPIVKAIDDAQSAWQINRNTLYKVEATINAPGAEDNKEPHTLQNLKYYTEEWKTEEISVGNEVHPKYLEVNKNLLEMHNVDTDATLEFTSSSTIKSVTISNAYYYNKYGNKIAITNYNSNGMSTSFDNNTLSGMITINSKIPENLTARYFMITVTNQDNLTETIKVIQYPVICVYNQLGWYSYREDFNFNWESQQKDGAYVSVGANYNNWDAYTGNYYGTRASNNNGENNWNYVNYFFNSKVIETITSDNQNDRTHTSRFYNGNKNTANCETHNMRMYQMQVMATSDEYVIGKPRLNVDGYTDRSVENNKLVSPSFMIASRLGAVYSGYGNTDELANGGGGGLTYNNEIGSFVTNNYNINNDELLKFYEDHCKNYVEVVGTSTNKKIYKDWRLPTSAEIIFIINNQGTSGQDSDAIDYLLNGTYYYSANGPVYNSKNNQGGKAIRCVHDVYDPSLVISKKE